MPRWTLLPALAETVAVAIAAEMPVWLHVPGPPGHTAAVARIDAVLREYARTGNLAIVLHILRLAHARGKQGDFEPVVFDGDAA